MRMTAILIDNLEAGTGRPAAQPELPRELPRQPPRRPTR